MTEDVKNNRVHIGLFISFLVIFIWSGYRPSERFVWVLEVLPAVIGIVICILTYRKFRLTTLVYILLWLGFVYMLIGGHYTYDEVPLFDWMKQLFHSDRNYYDRVGHILNGVVTSVTIRELLKRKYKNISSAHLLLFVISFTLAASAAYELIEWGVAAIVDKSSADAFLGMQGDIWDTHWDMLMALSGGVIALLALSKLHDYLVLKQEGITAEKY